MLVVTKILKSFHNKNDNFDKNSIQNEKFLVRTR